MKMFAAIVASMMFFLSACNDKENGVVSPRELFNTMLQTGSINAGDVDCFFKISSMIYCNEFDNVSKSNFAWAYISNGITYLKLSDVKCNGEQMEDISGGFGGQYQYALIDDYLHLIDWEINNYIGANYNKTDTNYPEIVVTNIGFGDTLSKSSGININYTGYTGGNSIIEVYINMWEQDIITGMIKEYKAKHIASDDGNIYITPMQLNGFSTISSNPNAWVTIQLYRTKFEVEDFNGKMFVKQYETLYFNHFVLAD